MIFFFFCQDASTPVTPHRDAGDTEQQGGVVTGGNNGSIEQLEGSVATPPPVPRKQKRLTNQVGTEN